MLLNEHQHLGHLLSNTNRAGALIPPQHTRNVHENCLLVIKDKSCVVLVLQHRFTVWLNHFSTHQQQATVLSKQALTTLAKAAGEEKLTNKLAGKLRSGSLAPSVEENTAESRGKCWTYIFLDSCDVCVQLKVRICSISVVCVRHSPCCVFLSFPTCCQLPAVICCPLKVKNNNVKKKTKHATFRDPDIVAKQFSAWV